MFLADFQWFNSSIGNKLGINEMSVLGDYMNQASLNSKLKTALAAAGTLAVLATATPALAQQGDALIHRNTITVESTATASAIEARVDTQLQQMKRMSQALSNSYDLVSPNIKNSDKGRNLAAYYTSAMQNVANPDLKTTDSYFVRAADGASSATTDLAATLKSINDKKQTLLEATYYLQQVQHAMVSGKTSDVEKYSDRLNQVASRINDAPKPQTEPTIWKIGGGEKISVSLDRDAQKSVDLSGGNGGTPGEPRSVQSSHDTVSVELSRDTIPVELKREKKFVEINRDKILVEMERGPIPSRI